MSLQETAISKPSRDFYSTNDERLRVISSSVSMQRRAVHEASPRSTEANGNIGVPSDKGEQGPHCRIDRQVAPSDGYDELLMRDVARGDASAMRMIFCVINSVCFASFSGSFTVTILRRMWLARCSLTFGALHIGSSIGPASRRGCSRSPDSRRSTLSVGRCTRIWRNSICPKPWMRVTRLRWR